jgi:hypothetical protein
VAGVSDAELMLEPDVNVLAPMLVAASIHAELGMVVKGV